MRQVTDKEGLPLAAISDRKSARSTMKSTKELSPRIGDSSGRNFETLYSLALL